MFQINAPLNQSAVQSKVFKLASKNLFGGMSFGPSGRTSSSPKWKDSPYFQDKRQDFYQEYYEYKPYDLSSALEQEQKILALVPQIRESLAKDVALQDKLKSARAKIEERLSAMLKDQTTSLQPDIKLSEALFKNVEGQLNLDYSSENGWVLSFYGNQPDRPRNISGDYTIAYPMMPLGDSLVSRETKSPSWADEFHSHAVQVTPNVQVNQDHFSIVSVCDQEIPQNSYSSPSSDKSTSPEAPSTQKRAAGTLIELGLWEPLKALKFTFQSLKSLLDILKPPAQNPPSNPSDEDKDLDEIWGGYIG
jgi:hypothetical protein